MSDVTKTGEAVDTQGRRIEIGRDSDGAYLDLGLAGRYLFAGRELEKLREAVDRAAMPADRFVTVEEHRWYAVVRVNGEFWRAFAGGREFSGLGVFDDEEEFEEWRRG